MAKDLEKAAEKSRSTNKAERLEKARSDAEQYAEATKKHGDELLKKASEADEINSFGLLQNQATKPYCTEPRSSSLPSLETLAS